MLDEALFLRAESRVGSELDAAAAVMQKGGHVEKTEGADVWGAKPSVSLRSIDC